MITYLLFFASIFILGTVPLFFGKDKKIFKILAALLPVLFIYFISVLKSNDVGIDTSVYAEYYEGAKNVPFSSMLNYHGWEPLFSFFMVSFAKMGLPFRVFQAFLYLLIYVPLFFFVLKHDKLPGLSLVLYSMFSFLVLNFSALRQSVAISLCMLAILLLAKKKIINIIFGILSICIGVLFHYSTIVFFLAVPLMFIRNPLKAIPFAIMIILFVFAFSPLIYTFIANITNLSDYVPILRTDAWETFAAYLLILILLVMIFKKDSKMVIFLDKFGLKIDGLISSKIKVYPKITKTFSAQKSDGETHYFNLLLPIFAIGVALESFILSSYVFPRMALFFLPYCPFLLTDSIYRFKSSSIKIIILIVFLAVFSVYFYFAYISPNYLHCVPYQLWN